VFLVNQTFRSLCETLLGSSDYLNHLLGRLGPYGLARLVYLERRKSMSSPKP
jgi:hypothetical protein